MQHNDGSRLGAGQAPNVTAAPERAPRRVPTPAASWMRGGSVHVEPFELPAVLEREVASDHALPSASARADDALAARLALASTQSELDAIGSSDSAERGAHELRAQTARALHSLLGAEPVEHVAGDTVRRVERMTLWLAERAALDAAAAGALALARETLAAMQRRAPGTR